MLKEPTAGKLYDLKLNAMAREFMDPERGSEGLSFDERFSLMVDKEWYAKKNARTARLIAMAGFSMPAEIEGVEYGKGRNISRKDVALLGGCGFIGRKLNVIITGKTGAGKSYLACAVGHAACRNGHSCRYYRLPDLSAELGIARMEGRYLKFMSSLGKAGLLIIDDMALKPYSLEESRDLLEIAERRYNRSSTVFASQAPHTKWYDLIPDRTVADAFMDRVVHNALVVALDSETSMREVMAKRALQGAGA
jgi:DNA replication protein DnaC